MDVADPPMVQNLLFEQPWPLVVAMGVLAAVLWVLGGRRAKGGRLRGAALLVVAAAAGVVVLAWQVTTHRERLAAQTHHLVALAVHPIDLRALDALFAPHAELVGPNGGRWLTYPAVREELAAAVQRFAIEDQSIRQLGVEAQGDRGRSVFEVRTQLGGQAGGLPIHSVWSLRWRRQDDGTWRIVEVACLQLRGLTPEQGFWRR